MVFQIENKHIASGPTHLLTEDQIQALLEFSHRYRRCTVKCHLTLDNRIYIDEMGWFDRETYHKLDTNDLIVILHEESCSLYVREFMTVDFITTD